MRKNGSYWIKEVVNHNCIVADYDADYDQWSVGMEDVSPVQIDERRLLNPDERSLIEHNAHTALEMAREGLSDLCNNCPPGWVSVEQAKSTMRYIKEVQKQWSSITET